ncbi:MAG: hypothetical protein AB1801_15610 [Chloroflexota bacterium]
MLKAEFSLQTTVRLHLHPDDIEIVEDYETLQEGLKGVVVGMAVGGTGVAVAAGASDTGVALAPLLNGQPCSAVVVQDGAYVSDNEDVTAGATPYAIQVLALR